MDAGEHIWHEVVTAGSDERERSRRFEMAVECSRFSPCSAHLRLSNLSFFSLHISIPLTSLLPPNLFLSLSFSLLSPVSREWVDALSTWLQIN